MNNVINLNIVFNMNNVKHGNQDRRLREKSEIRLRVMDAARELFLSGGEEAVALRRIAERIEYSATSIYLYFPNKESLIQELCQADFAVYSRVFQQAERIPNPLARLRKIASTYVDFGLLYPAHYRAMFMTPPSAKPTKEEKPRASLPVAEGSGEARKSPAAPNPYDFLHTAVFKAMAAGCFRPQYRDVALIAQVIWSGLHGMISLHLVRARYAAVNWRPVQTGVETMIDCLITGLTNENDATD